MKPFLVAAAAAAFAALATFAALEWRQRERTLALDRDILEAQGRILRLQAVKMKVEEFEAKKRIVEEKVTLIERLRATPSCPDRFLAAATANVDGLAWERTLLTVAGRPGSADATAAALRGLGLTIVRAGSSENAFGIFATVPPDFCGPASSDSAKRGGP